MVFEYEVEKVLAGTFRPERIRVAHRSILDGQPLPTNDPEPGALCRLVLEPYAENPQLQSLYLSDTLEEAPDRGLFYHHGF